MSSPWSSAGGGHSALNSLHVGVLGVAVLLHAPLPHLALHGPSGGHGLQNLVLQGHVRRLSKDVCNWR